MQAHFLHVHGCVQVVPCTKEKNSLVCRCFHVPKKKKKVSNANGCTWSYSAGGGMDYSLHGSKILGYECFLLLETKASRKYHKRLCPRIQTQLGISLWMLPLILSKSIWFSSYYHLWSWWCRFTGRDRWSEPWLYGCEVSNHGSKSSQLIRTRLVSFLYWQNSPIQKT